MLGIVLVAIGAYTLMQWAKTPTGCAFWRSDAEARHELNSHRMDRRQA